LQRYLSEQARRGAGEPWGVSAATTIRWMIAPSFGIADYPAQILRLLHRPIPMMQRIQSNKI
jgi:hypothetical protein